MSLAELSVDHCSLCGKIHQKNARNLCHECSQKTNEQLELCLHFLKRNRNANPEMLSEETNVPLKQITHFISKNWISLRDYPHLSYPCKNCEAPIRNDSMCTHCKAKLLNDIDRMLRNENETLSRQQNQSSYYKDR